jgi:hypothetical protein
LPQEIIDDPSLINSAELILCPLQISFTKNDEDKPSKIIIRRVMDKWVDSSTNWINQPSQDSTLKVSKLIKAKNKNYPVSIDVTKLVIKMLQKTNNGFLISMDNITDSSMASGQSFASPNFQFEELRPLLVIDYRGLSMRMYSSNQWQGMPDLSVTSNYPLFQPAATAPVAAPVKVITEPGNNPPIIPKTKE